MRIRRLLSLGWAIAAVTLCTVPPAAAVDGVIEINPARALAGSVTPGDGGGFPVTISASGSYRLTGNLTVDKDTTAIEVEGTAREVTIDLNGFAIIGPVECAPAPACTPTSGSGFGIHAPVNGTRVRILNGTIRGMGDSGIRADSATVELVTARDNRLGGILAGRSSVVSHSVADNNGGNGIETYPNSVVRDCSANDNGNAGIYAGNSAVIANNTANSNHNIGIIGGGGSTITGNSTSSNTFYGIMAASGTVVDNSSSYNLVGLYASYSVVGYARNVFFNNSGGDVIAAAGATALQTGVNVCGTGACP